MQPQPLQPLHWAESHKVQGSMPSLLWFLCRDHSDHQKQSRWIYPFNDATSKSNLLKQKSTRRRVFRKKICLHRLQLKLAAQWLLDAMGKANQIMCLTVGNLMGRLPSHRPSLKTSSNLKLVWQPSVAEKCTTYIFSNTVYLVNGSLTSKGNTIRYFSSLRNFFSSAPLFPFAALPPAPLRMG